MNQPKIIFLGTPEFAVTSLEALVENKFSVAAVVTAPDRPAGRGLRMTESAVKQFAIKKNIPVLQPLKLKDPVFLEHLKSYGADLQVVVAFRMLPELVWAMPVLGTINLHGSLLPQYRGAAPINRAIMNGETLTGVTTFKLQQEIDTGNVLLQEEIPIAPDETAGILHDRMKVIGAQLVVRTVKGLIEGGLEERSQNATSSVNLKTAPKIFKEDCEISWGDHIDKIYNQVRGLSPFPGAYTFFNEKMLKIYRVRKETIKHVDKSGIIESDNRSWMRYSAGGGYIYIEEMQLEGKKRMTIADFLRGYRPLTNSA